jgi:MoxR-like ATPase
MLTKFTEPSEILGPIDIDLLKQGRFMRRTKGNAARGEGGLPRRDLQVEQRHPEHAAHHRERAEVLPGRRAAAGGAGMLFAATNDIPEQSELDALADRFIVKVETRPVKDTITSASSSTRGS